MESTYITVNLTIKGLDIKALFDKLVTTTKRFRSHRGKYNRTEHHIRSISS